VYFAFVFLVYFLLFVLSLLTLFISTHATDCGKTCLQNNLLYVEQDVKLYSLTHSLKCVLLFVHFLYLNMMNKPNKLSVVCWYSV